MRIVHVVRTAAFAGVERHVATLAATQRDAGHRVAVVGGDPARMRATIARDDVLHRRAATIPAAVHEIRDLAGCDVLHAHMTAAELAVLLTTRACGVPLVATRHFARRRSASSPARVLAPLIRRRIAAQVAISRFVADRIDGDATVVLPGVPDRLDPVDPGSRRPVVLMAQRLVPEKRTDLGIRAFAGSGLAREGWRLDVAGAGAERPHLEALAGALGLADAVRFLGRRADVARLMDRSAILLAPCPIDGAGLSVLEAMASGLPVVAAAGGGHLETVATVPGAATFDPQDLAAAGAALRDLGHDADRRRAYGLAEREVQREHFTLLAQQRATEAVYRTVLP